MDYSVNALAPHEFHADRDNAGTVADRAAIHGLPSVSIIIPCRNETAFIASCLDSIISNDYPLELIEVLVVDGMSADGTREIVGSYSQRHRSITMLDNPRRTTPCALNIGIAAASGDVLLRMDAHTSFERGYIRTCVDALERNGGTDNVSGVLRLIPMSDGLVDRAVVRTRSHPFGGGRAPHRTVTGGAPRFVELVPFFCCRRELIHKAGAFNEHLLRHQDFDFLTRLKQLGARCLLVPGAVCNYYARSDFASFYKHEFRDGLWVLLALGHSDALPFLPRHLVPLAFVLALIAGSIAAMFSTAAAWGLGAIVALYGGAALIAAAQIALQERDLRMLAVMPAMFAIRHIMFGLGSLAGLVRVVMSGGFRNRIAARFYRRRTNRSM